MGVGVRGLSSKDEIQQNSTNFQLARCQWLTPVIQATKEVEIRRITVEVQPRQKKKILSQKYQCKKGLVEWLKW
jgi:hypothetical protein